MGPHCNDDDQLFLDMFEERERQWQQQRSQVCLIYRCTSGLCPICMLCDEQCASKLLQLCVQLSDYCSTIHNLLQAEAERQASQYAAGPGPSSSSATTAIASLSRAPSIEIANPLQHTALPQLPGRPLQRGGLGRSPFAAPPFTLHSIPAQVSLHTSHFCHRCKWVIACQHGCRSISCSLQGAELWFHPNKVCLVCCNFEVVHNIFFKTVWVQCPEGLHLKLAVCPHYLSTAAVATFVSTASGWYVGSSQVPDRSGHNQLHFFLGGAFNRHRPFALLP